MDDNDIVAITQKEEAIALFRQNYNIMFGDISGMLRKAKLTPIMDLQGQDPSFTNMAVELEHYMFLLDKLGCEIEISSQYMARAREYLILVHQLAEAIENDDCDSLGAAIAALDEKPYI